MGQETWWGEENPVEKVYTKVYTFVSDSIGCDKVEIIMITRAKGEFGLRFKNGLFKEI